MAEGWRSTEPQGSTGSGEDPDGQTSEGGCCSPPPSLHSSHAKDARQTKEDMLVKYKICL